MAPISPVVFSLAFLRCTAFMRINFITVHRPVAPSQWKTCQIVRWPSTVCDGDDLDPHLHTTMRIGRTATWPAAMTGCRLRRAAAIDCGTERLSEHRPETVYLVPEFDVDSKTDVTKAYITIAIQLRYDYDTTTAKNWHVHFLLASNRVEWKQARAIRRSRIAVESQL